MGKITSQLIRAQALAAREAELGRARSQQLAVDVDRMCEAVLAARERLDFNDEPSRFAALLATGAYVPLKRT